MQFNNLVPINYPAPSHFGTVTVLGPKSATGPVMYLQWLKRRFPEAYRAVELQARELIDVTASNGLGALAQETSAATSSWADTIKQIAAGAVQGYQSKRMIDLNAELIKQGRPPIESDALAAQVSVGVSKDVQRMALLGLGAVTLIAMAFIFVRRR